jgi:hypothetical protein
MKKTFLIYAILGLFLTGFGAFGVSAQKRVLWNGVWGVPSRFTPATLTIKPLSATSFKFKIEAMTGANMGDVSGVAKIKGNKAYFDDRQSSKKAEDKYGCTLTFTHMGTFIDIKASNKCQNYAGLNVYFDNRYYKGKRKPLETDFVYLEVFPNKALDGKFKLLVGRDYERFLNAFHQIYPEDDLDKLGATVYSACVEGMCSFWAGIIMYDKQGNFWAAVLDDSAADKIVARYYTNAPGWADKLPQTIDKFIAEKREANNGNLTIVFKSKK